MTALQQNERDAEQKRNAQFAEQMEITHRMQVEAARAEEGRRLAAHDPRERAHPQQRTHPHVGHGGTAQHAPRRRRAVSERSKDSCQAVDANVGSDARR